MALAPAAAFHPAPTLPLSSLFVPEGQPTLAQTFKFGWRINYTIGVPKERLTSDTSTSGIEQPTNNFPIQIEASAARRAGVAHAADHFR